MKFNSLTELPDAEILAQAKQLVQGECEATAVLVAHLAEIDRRKLYLGEGCSSLFTYCTDILHLSESAAYNRIQAARAAARFPAVLRSLVRGDVHLAALKMLAPLFTPENHLELLAAARHCSKRELQLLIARMRPQPDAPDAVRKLPAARKATAGANGAARPAALMNALPFAEKTVPEPAAATVPEPAVAAGSQARPAMVAPLAPERYKVQFTAGAGTYSKLRRAQELLRHRIPNGDVATVIDQALELLVRELEKKKFAALEQPRRNGVDALRDPGASRGANGAGAEASRHIPAAVKRAVWERDQGRCTFIGSNGVRCTERGRLEFDHIRPHGDGGTATLDNVRLLCRCHNQYEAQQFFGMWHSEDGGQPAVGG